MKVLAIDPGYGRCGVAVVEKTAGKEVLLHSECIVTPASAEFAERLAIVTGACEKIIKKHRPDGVALEKLYFEKNQKTAMRVAEVRGALIDLASRHHVPVSEYTPGQVKVAAGGHGGAGKTQMAKMLHALVKITKEIKYDDEYDAIAIGITHLATNRH